MLIRSFILLAAAAPFAFADVSFTTPAPGASIAGGGTMTVEWKDSGSAPSISDLTSYQLFLCAGGNDATSYVSSSIALAHLWSLYRQVLMCERGFRSSWRLYQVKAFSARAIRRLEQYRRDWEPAKRMHSMLAHIRRNSVNSMQLSQDDLRGQGRWHCYQLLVSIFPYRHDGNFSAERDSWNCNGFGNEWSTYGKQCCAGCTRGSTTGSWGLRDTLYVANGSHQVRTNAATTTDKDRREESYSSVAYECGTICYYLAAET